MRTVLAIAPHPDDETLGCGGALLRHSMEGDRIHWLIATEILDNDGWTSRQKEKRHEEIKLVSRAYGFTGIHNLSLPTTRLDTLPLNQVIEKIGNVFRSISPDVLYVPFAHDVHTDHQVTAKAISACLKWFRYPSIRRVLAYETLSETSFNYTESCFCPNVFMDISSFLQRKVEIMKLYESELEEHPFPRSEKALNALAILRGSYSGYEYAEAFELILEKL